MNLPPMIWVGSLELFKGSSWSRGFSSPYLSPTCTERDTVSAWLWTGFNSCLLDANRVIELRRYRNELTSWVCHYYWVSDIECDEATRVIEARQLDLSYREHWAEDITYRYLLRIRVAFDCIHRNAEDIFHVEFAYVQLHCSYCVRRRRVSLNVRGQYDSNACPSFPSCKI